MSAATGCVVTSMGAVNPLDQAYDSVRVAVLLATCNGEPFLAEQLQSLAMQTLPAIDIHVSDDASSDGTMRILTDWAQRWTKGAFTITQGPCKGFAENFRSLLANAQTQADFVAFCDQDDLWEPGKLEQAITWIGHGKEQPRLFCSRTRLVDANGADAGHSAVFVRPPSFRNALVQSIAGGNTMVFNRAAHRLLAKASARASFISHDWWAYIIVTGSGGEVCYSTEPLVRYRQHRLNSVGANTSLQARLTRVKRLMSGQFSTWTAVNIKAIEANLDMLTAESLADFDHFRACRSGSMASRLHHLRASGVYRQSIAGDLALYTAVILGRL